MLSGLSAFPSLVLLSDPLAHFQVGVPSAGDRDQGVSYVLEFSSPVTLVTKTSKSCHRSSGSCVHHEPATVDRASLCSRELG